MSSEQLEEFLGRGGAPIQFKKDLHPRGRGGKFSQRLGQIAKVAQVDPQASRTAAAKAGPRTPEQAVAARQHAEKVQATQHAEKAVFHRQHVLQRKALIAQKVESKDVAGKLDKLMVGDTMRVGPGVKVKKVGPKHYEVIGPHGPETVKGSKWAARGSLEHRDRHETAKAVRALKPGQEHQVRHSQVKIRRHESGHLEVTHADEVNVEHNKTSVHTSTTEAIRAGHARAVLRNERIAPDKAALVDQSKRRVHSASVGAGVRAVNASPKQAEKIEQLNPPDSRGDVGVEKVVEVMKEIAGSGLGGKPVGSTLASPAEHVGGHAEGLSHAIHAAETGTRLDPGVVGHGHPASELLHRAAGHLPAEHTHGVLKAGAKAAEQFLAAQGHHIAHHGDQVAHFLTQLFTARWERERAEDGFAWQRARAREVYALRKLEEAGLPNAGGIVAKWEEAKHPRGSGGKFGHVFNAPNAPARAPKKPQKPNAPKKPNAPEPKPSVKAKTPGKPTPSAATQKGGKAALKGDEPGPDGFVDCGSDVNKAADLLAAGKKVRLAELHQASTLLGELAARVQEAKRLGDKAPNYNLCQVTVKGTNLFCAESKGIPRVKMPQLSGVPTPGTAADKLEKNDKGEVVLTDQFRQSLIDNGATVTDDTQKASYLKASQNELNGAKVAGMVQALDAGKQLGGDPRLFVSQDDYIVDGHHRWAANVGHDLEDGTLGDVTMPVQRVDMGIIELLDAANKFASDMGIPQASVNTPAPDTKTPVPDAKALVPAEKKKLAESVSQTFNPSLHPRDRVGEFRDIANLGVTPFRGKGKAQGTDYYDTSRYKGFENNARKIAQDNGASIEKIDRVRGIWDGGGEPSAQVTIKGDAKQVNSVMDELGRRYNQDAVLSFRSNPKGKSVRYLSAESVEPDRVNEAMSKVNLPGATIRADGKLEIIDLDDSMTDDVAKVADHLDMDFEYDLGDGELRFKGQHYGRAEEARSASPYAPNAGQEQDARGHDPGHPDREAWLTLREQVARDRAAHPEEYLDEAILHRFRYFKAFKPGEHHRDRMGRFVLNDSDKRAIWSALVSVKRSKDADKVWDQVEQGKPLTPEQREQAVRALVAVKAGGTVRHPHVGTLVALGKLTDKAWTVTNTARRTTARR